MSLLRRFFKLQNISYLKRNFMFLKDGCQKNAILVLQNNLRTISVPRACRHYSSGPVISEKSVDKENNETANSQVLSSLYVPSSKRSVFCSILDPYLDFDQYADNIDKLEMNLKKRKLDNIVSKEKLLYLKENWKKFQDILNKREEIERQIKKFQNQIRTLSTIKEECNEKVVIETTQVKQEILTLKQSLKEYNIVEYEENLIPAILALPNIVSPDTPIDEDKIVSTHLNKPVYNFTPLTHVELGKLNRNIDLSSVSPGAFYLMKDLAEVELALEDYFVELFHDQHYTHHSNPDLSKGVLAEGCGFNIHDTDEILKILYQRDTKDNTSLFLTGGCSLPSFTAYFAKRVVGKPQKFLPQKLFATGRLYNPLQLLPNHSNDHLPASILNSMQSSAVSAFIAYSGEAHSDDEMTREISNLLIQAYENLGVHFRVVQKSAKNLDKHESAAYSIEMFTTAKDTEILKDASNLDNNYIEIGRISIIGNYISKRLLMLHTSNTQVNTNTFKPSLGFLNVIYIKVMDISKFIALLVENNQTEDGKYHIPSSLNKHLLK